METIQKLIEFSNEISILEISYLVASVLFILGLKKLSHPLTARAGSRTAAARPRRRRRRMTPPEQLKELRKCARSAAYFIIHFVRIEMQVGGFAFVQDHADLFDLQNHLDHVFTHTRDIAEFMQDIRNTN